MPDIHRYHGAASQLTAQWPAGSKDSDQLEVTPTVCWVEMVCVVVLLWSHSREL